MKRERRKIWNALLRLPCYDITKPSHCKYFQTGCPELFCSHGGRLILLTDLTTCKREVAAA